MHDASYHLTGLIGGAADYCSDAPGVIALETGHEGPKLSRRMRAGAMMVSAARIDAEAVSESSDGRETAASLVNRATTP